MAIIDYATLKTKVLNGGGLGSEYETGPQDDISKVLKIKGKFSIDLSDLQAKVKALQFSEESDQTFTSGVTTTVKDSQAVSDMTGIDMDGRNVYTPTTGGSMFLNSDRVVINAKDDFAMFLGEKGVAIASPNRVNIDAGDTITLFGHNQVLIGLPNAGNKIDPKTTTDKPTPTTVGDSRPDEKYEPMVLGIKLINLIEDFIYTVQNAEMAAAVGNGVFQPSTVANFELLKLRLPECISNYAYVDGISHDAVDPDRLALLKIAKEEALLQDYVPPSVLTGNFEANVDLNDPNNYTPKDPNPVTTPFAGQPDYYTTPDPGIYNDSADL
tara:strand:- start:1496 stop:2473 length:978 start_codon:yes stop_codon:yes gene_type:complete